MTDDWRINSQVIAVLTKNWIDLRRLNITTTNGVVYIRGLLVFYYNMEEKQTHISSSSKSKEEIIEEEKIRMIEKHLKRIPGVKGLKLDFINWGREGRQWKKRIG